MATQEDINNAFQEFKDKFQPAEKSAIDEGRTLVTSRKMKISVDDFEFEIRTTILPRQIRVYAKLQKVDLTNYEHFDELNDLLAEIMEIACIDKKYNKDFWLQYNEETGNLYSIVEYIFENVKDSKPQITSFR